MNARPPFPLGLTVRSAAPADIPAVTALLRAAETFDSGEPYVTLEDVESAWEIPGFDPALDSLLVADGDRFVAYAEVPGWRAEAAVHPDARGRGIGAALLGWMEQRAVQRAPRKEEIRLGQTVIDTNTEAISLLVRHGYAIRHTSWALRLPDDVTVDPRVLPDGITIRPYNPLDEEHQVYRVIEDAFNEWPTRQPTGFEEWKTHVTGRSDFDPSLLLVAATATEVVGVAFGIPYPDEGWVEQLAVHRKQRGRGIARALLHASFDEFRRRGLPVVGLSTDSRTGALDLYLDIGMVVHASFAHYSKLLSAENPIGGDR